MILCGFLIVHNEEIKGNIRRCLDNMKKLCDVIAIYDDASTDNTVKICKEYTPHVIVGEKNIGFPNKPQKNILMKYVTEKIKPDWLWWIDADEIVDQNGIDGAIRKLCELGDNNNIESFELHEINLYINECWKRVDRLYDAGWYCRLWKNNGNLRFEEEKVLHPVPFPVTLKNKVRNHSINVIHYGFSSMDRIKDKYLLYNKAGLKGERLERLKPLGEMELLPVDKSVFPEENMPKDASKPRPLTEEEWERIINV